MIGDLKEVLFNEYCAKCKHFKTKESEEPCCDCLSEPGNQDSHKPVYFDEAEK